MQSALARVCLIDNDQQKMKLVSLVPLLLLLAVGSAHGQTTAASGGEVMLSRSKQAPGLRLLVICPAGWTFTPTPNATTALGRFIRKGTDNREMIIVTATPLPVGLMNKNSDEVFTERFVRDFGAAWQAKACRRIRDDFWDGVFTLYTLPETITKGRSSVDVEDWMMISNGYRVEFNCYFERDSRLTVDQQTHEFDELRKRYREVLNTVRKEPVQLPESMSGLPPGHGSS